MTDNDDTDQTQQRDDASDWQQPDDMLALLVDIINDAGGLEIGVTLYVHGTIVDGLLISGRSYFDLLAERVTGQGTVADALGRGFTTRADGYREQETRDRDAAEEQPAWTTRYVHVRNATMHAPGYHQPIEQGLWRGRLTAVDGWSLGNFGPKPPLEQQ